MKKTAMAVLAAVAVCAHIAAADASGKKIADADAAKQAEAKHAAARERMLRASGGMIARPGSLQGKVTVVNAQKDVPADGIADAAKTLARLMRINVEMAECESADFGSAAEVAAKFKANARVVVVSDGKCRHRLAYFPAENLAVVNVAALAADSPSAAVLKARAAKEAARGLCYACGAGASAHDDALTGGKPSLGDLDEMAEVRYPMDALARMRSYLNSLGVTPEVKAPYIRACREGWAPAPTNEYQKAVWDKVHALPTEPIKITPETKKTAK